MLNFSMPKPQSPFVDLKTGMVSREWYLFLQSVFTASGGGNDLATQLNDLQIMMVNNVQSNGMDVRDHQRTATGRLDT